jgi:hypothetical protein
MLRIVILAVLLLTTGLARAGEGDTHDGGWDTGAKLALGGGIAFSAAYSATAIGTGLASLCGLGDPTCGRGHDNLYVPLVGGFLPSEAHDGWSQPVGLFSSILQIGAAGVMVGGLIAHHWRAKRASP